MNNIMIGAVKAPRESDINFRVGSMVYSSRNKQTGIVVTRDEYGRNKMINNAQTPVYFPKGKKVVAVYNRYLESLDDRIGGIGATKVFAKAVGQKIVADYYSMVGYGFDKKEILNRIYKQYGRSEAKENYIKKLVDQNKEIYEQNKNKAYIPDRVYKA
jgi:hypothetical protein